MSNGFCSVLATDEAWDAIWNKVFDDKESTHHTVKASLDQIIEAVNNCPKPTLAFVKQKLGSAKQHVKDVFKKFEVDKVPADAALPKAKPKAAKGVKGNMAKKGPKGHLSKGAKGAKTKI